MRIEIKCDGYKSKQTFSIGERKVIVNRCILFILLFILLLTLPYFNKKNLSTKWTRISFTTSMARPNYIVSMVEWDVTMCMINVMMYKNAQKTF